MRSSRQFEVFKGSPPPSLGTIFFQPSINPKKKHLPQKSQKPQIPKSTHPTQIIDLPKNTFLEKKWKTNHEKANKDSRLCRNLLSALFDIGKKIAYMSF